MLEGVWVRHVCRPSSQARVRILGFYWPNSSNILIVTTNGMEFYSVWGDTIRSFPSHPCLR